MVSHRHPLVELIVVGHGVKLAAQHLSKAGLILLAGLCVTSAITLPFPSAVFAPKHWSVGKKSRTLRTQYGVIYLNINVESETYLVSALWYEFRSIQLSPGAVTFPLR